MGSTNITTRLVRHGPNMNNCRSKHKEVQVVNPTRLLGAQIVNIFVKELQIDEKNTEKEDESTESSGDDVSKHKRDSGIRNTESHITESNAEPIKKKISSSHEKLQHILKELLETEANYVQDLEEEVIKL